LAGRPVFSQRCEEPRIGPLEIKSIREPSHGDQIDLPGPLAVTAAEPDISQPLVEDGRLRLSGDGAEEASLRGDEASQEALRARGEGLEFGRARASRQCSARQRQRTLRLAPLDVEVGESRDRLGVVRPKAAQALE